VSFKGTEGNIVLVPKHQKRGIQGDLDRIKRKLAKNETLVSRTAIKLEDLRAAQAALERSVEARKRSRQ
jgi:hypothetical protein